jgi:hypothetical protein
MKFVGPALLLMLLIQSRSEAQDQSKPQAVPLFSSVEQGPAFMLQCVNGPIAEVRALEVIQEAALRVDGKLYERTGGITGSFLGGEPVFGPGERWWMMVGLRQASLGTKSADFGAALRTPWDLPLRDGPHSIEFRCHGVWSDRVEFYWESAIVPR